MDAKKRSGLIIFVCCSILFCFAGCADNEYVDTTLGLTVQQLDGDLDDRWSTTGVVIKNIHAGKTSNQSKLKVGELISHVIGERTINTSSDFNQAVESAMRDGNSFTLEFTNNNQKRRRQRFSVRRKGDDVGISVDDNNRIKKIKSGTLANNAGLKEGDQVLTVIDAKNIRTIKDYQKAIKEFSRSKAKISFRTKELIGVKIAAINALASIADASAVETMIRFLEGTDLSLREPAAKGLERLVALSQLNDLFQQFQQKKADQLSTEELNSEALQRAEILGLLAVDLQTNQAILKDPIGTEFRRRSATLYQKISSTKITELAKKYIKREIEPNQEIRRSCLSILGNLQPESVIGDLIAVLEDNQETSGIRFKAGSTLSQIGSSAVEPLIVSFGNGDSGIRDITASSLGNIGGSQARQALIAFLKNENNETTKLTLVDAIAQIGDETSIRILEEQQENLDQNSGLATFLNEILTQRTETKGTEAETDSLDFLKDL